MSMQQILGVVLILVALLDAVLGIVVIGPRIADPRAGRSVMTGLLIGAAVMATIGVALLAGAF